jgi:hypothetical protein
MNRLFLALFAIVLLLPWLLYSFAPPVISRKRMNQPGRKPGNSLFQPAYILIPV